jgi:tRNA (guanosine-2'-O-)-methyltransferase
VACAVSLYEAYRQKKLAGHYDNPRLDPAHSALLMKEWGFLDQDLSTTL